MNKSQTNSLKLTTCYILDSFEPTFERLKECGMPDNEIKIIDDFLNKIFELNQKYVKLSEGYEDDN